jgi:hypothetical protein
VPARPKGRAGQTAPSSPIHYRDDAYDKILVAAIRAGDLETAHDTVELWKASGGKPAIRIVQAWLNADHPTEALAFARSLSDVTERITALLAVAQELLNQAGAPNV